MRSPCAAGLHLLHVVVVCPPPQHVLSQMQSSVQSPLPIIIILWRNEHEKTAEKLIVSKEKY